MTAGVLFSVFHSVYWCSAVPGARSRLKVVHIRGCKTAFMGGCLSAFVRGTE
jgi:hypothetical protein